MTITEQQRAFLDEVHYAVVGTHNADGSIQQTVVWFMLEGNDIRFSIGANSVKARNLSRDPAITLTVEAGPRYLTLTGVARVEPADPELRLRLAKRYLGEERAAVWVAQSPGKDRASVRMSIRRVYGQGV